MKKIKLALLTVALASSSMAVMAQDKATLIKQFIDIQRPGIESLARGLVDRSHRRVRSTCRRRCRKPSVKQPPRPPTQS